MATPVVKVQPQGFCVSYPKTRWRVTFVEESTGKFYFRLYGEDFHFEPRDRYRYLTYADARQAAYCFLELMKRLERSRMKLGILAEIGLLKFPQQIYCFYELFLVVDRIRYTWEITTPHGWTVRGNRWYKQPERAIAKAQEHIEREVAITQIVEVVGWV